MGKIWLITQRELLTRIRKRSFIIMTLLGPLLFAGYLASTVFFATHQDSEVKHIVVCDSSHLFLGKIASTGPVTFEYQPVERFTALKAGLGNSETFGVLYIAPDIVDNPRAATLYSYREPGTTITQHLNNVLSKELSSQKLEAFQSDQVKQILQAIHTTVDMETVKLENGGTEKKGNSGVKMAMAYVGAFLIYIFILMYGVQVMRGVMEEKSNRIVEVIISSVKPFELMMGKVLGVAGAALLQFAIWVVLSLAFTFVVQATVMTGIHTTTLIHPPQEGMGSAASASVSPNIAAVFSMLGSMDFGVMIVCFLFYFIGGYLLYSALFAAIGSAVDNETDTQQFMLPITLPLILGIMAMVHAIQNPDSSMAVWFSIVPFTSPIVMMARIPYGVPYEQVALSMGLLLGSFLGAIWVAGKIYRTGILMYGKKTSYKEIWKWLTY